MFRSNIAVCWSIYVLMQIYMINGFFQNYTAVNISEMHFWEDKWIYPVKKYFNVYADIAMKGVFWGFLIKKLDNVNIFLNHNMFKNLRQSDFYFYKYLHIVNNMKTVLIKTDFCTILFFSNMYE